MARADADAAEAPDQVEVLAEGDGDAGRHVEEAREFPEHGVSAEAWDVCEPPAPGALFATGERGREPGERPTPHQPAVPVRHLRGNPDAAVTVVEYGDFECPYCAAAAPVLHEVVDGSDGGVRLEFRNFPLAQVHPYALTAALAAEAVSPYGVFWEMHDLLFTHQDRLRDVDLRSYAESLGVDGDAVVGDRAQVFGDRVEADFASGVELGVRGTPWLFVNGEHYLGRMEVAALRQATSAALAPRRVGGLRPRGDSPPRRRLVPRPWGQRRD